jgi:hypothetical protein
MDSEIISAGEQRCKESGPRVNETFSGRQSLTDGGGPGCVKTPGVEKRRREDPRFSSSRRTGIMWVVFGLGKRRGPSGPRLLVTKDATHLSHSEAVVKSVISNTLDLGCEKRRKRNKEI